jgi:hypothetical protein
VKCRILGIACATFVLVAVGCSGADEIPDAGSDSAPLTDEEILSVPAPTLEEYVKVYEEVLNQNPALDPESTHFARLILEKIKATASQSTPDVVALQAAHLPTRAEWLLLARNPGKAYGTATASIKAENRALNDFKSGWSQGKADAFRHAYWNLLMAKCCGLDWARDFSTAHESETTDLDDKTMDLNNNEVGRNIFSVFPAYSDELHVSLIKNSPASCMSQGVTHDSQRLVYIKPCPTITIVDEGPELGDVVEVALDGASLGTTPPGGERVFETRDLRTGSHTLSVSCQVGVRYGSLCTIDVRLSEGLTFVDGSDRWSSLIPRGLPYTYWIGVPRLAQ